MRGVKTNPARRVYRSYTFLRDDEDPLSRQLLKLHLGN